MNLLLPQESSTSFDIAVSRRTFMKAGGMAGVGVLALTTTACPGDKRKVTIYIQTVSAFLSEIGSIIPSQAQFIARIIKIGSDFDAAFQRGDLTDASTFFNSLDGNITTLFNNLGINVSDRVKVALTLVRSTVRLIAVLLVEQGATNPPAVRSARAAGGPIAEAIVTIQRLADPKAVDAIFSAARP